MSVSMIRKLLSTVLFSMMFMAIGFVILWLFDKMDLGLNIEKSEFMEKIIDLNWFHFFSRLELNGIFTLVVIIGILMIVFRLARLCSPKK